MTTIKKDLEISNLLAEMIRLPDNKSQKEILNNFFEQTKTKELSDKQKEVANKIYLQLRPKLVQKIKADLLKDINKSNSETYYNTFNKWNGMTAHYPLKDIKKAFNELIQTLLKNHENKEEIIVNYSIHFLL